MVIGLNGAIYSIGACVASELSHPAIVVGFLSGSLAYNYIIPK